MAPVSLNAGTILSGRYRLGEALGAGKLSSVYAAEDVRSGANVALKLFAPSVSLRSSALSEFQTQARAASGLGVEGVARAYDFGIDANSGLCFTTSERISWLCLERRLAAEGRTLTPHDLSRALGVLARAVDAAHGAHLVHRALTPQNVFISPDNPEWVRITDFGVSAIHRGSSEAMGFGGPHGYSAPEAVDAGVFGAPSMDLFSLGLVVFFALTRGSPFRSLRGQGLDANAHWAELNQSLAPLSERARELGSPLDPRFDAWFARALATRASDRFPNASQMAREFAAVAESAAARSAPQPHTVGIAAAIARPLLFQPEPSAASLGFDSSAVPLASADAFATTARAPLLGGPSSGRPWAAGTAVPATTTGNFGKKRAVLLGSLGLLAAAAAVLLGFGWAQDRSTQAEAAAAASSGAHELVQQALSAASSPPGATKAPEPSAVRQAEPAPSASSERAARAVASTEESPVAAAPKASIATIASAPSAATPAVAKAPAAVPTARVASAAPKATAAQALAPPARTVAPTPIVERKATTQKAVVASAKPAANAVASAPSSTKKQKCGTFLACK